MVIYARLEQGKTYRISCSMWAGGHQSCEGQQQVSVGSSGLLMGQGGGGGAVVVDTDVRFDWCLPACLPGTLACQTCQLWNGSYDDSYL